MLLICIFRPLCSHLHTSNEDNRHSNSRPPCQHEQKATQECHIRCSVFAEIASRERLGLNVARADYLDKVAQSEDMIASLRDELSRRDEQFAAFSTGLEHAMSHADAVAETMVRWQMHRRKSEEVSSH